MSPKTMKPFKNNVYCACVFVGLLTCVQQDVFATQISNSQFILDGQLIPATGQNTGSNGSVSFTLNGDTNPFESPNVRIPTVAAPVVPPGGGGGGGGGSTTLEKILNTIKDTLNKPLIGGVPPKSLTDLNDSLNKGSLGTGISGYDINGIPKVEYGSMLCGIPFKRSDFGSIGPYVAFIQKVMIDYKINTGKVDGKYKTLTKRAVRMFQQKYKKIYPQYIIDKKSMYVDGIWGVQTHALVQALHCKNTPSKGGFAGKGDTQPIIRNTQAK